MPTAKLTYLLPIGLAALMLSGCGSDDDNFFGSGGSSSRSISVNQFDTDSGAIARIKTTYQRGERNWQPTSLVGNYTGQKGNEPERSIVLANNFEGTMENKDITVSGNQVSRTIYQKNSNAASKLTIDYQEFDLEGISADSYKKESVSNKRVGVLTDLYSFPRVPSDLAFDRGAKCFTPVINSDRELVYFNEKNSTGYQKLNDWVRVTENAVNSNYTKSVITTSLGFNKAYPAAEINIYDNNQLIGSYNAVEYSGRVYTTTHIKSGQTTPNRNASTGVVDCTLINDTAADFLQEKIQQYY